MALNFNTSRRNLLQRKSRIGREFAPRRERAKSEVIVVTEETQRRGDEQQIARRLLLCLVTSPRNSTARCPLERTSGYPPTRSATRPSISREYRRKLAINNEISPKPTCAINYCSLRFEWDVSIWAQNNWRVHLLPKQILIEILTWNYSRSLRI